MNTPLLVTTALNISFTQLTQTNEAELLREYIALVQSVEEPIDKWLKVAKAKGDTSESDPVILNLLIELHKKVDALEKFLKNEEIHLPPLEHEKTTDSIGFEHIRLQENCFVAQEQYYARVQLPVYPKRVMGFFITSIDGSLAKITKMHERDEREWSSFITAEERAAIRILREGNI